MDYRSILKSEFAQRCDRNSGYSLRAFARDLKIHPSRLSAVLNGKKGLSKDSASDVAKILGFAPREAEMFCDLVEATHARSAAARGIAQASLMRASGSLAALLREVPASYFNPIGGEAQRERLLRIISYDNLDQRMTEVRLRGDLFGLNEEAARNFSYQCVETASPSWVEAWLEIEAYPDHRGRAERPFLGSVIFKQTNMIAPAGVEFSTGFFRVRLGWVRVDEEFTTNWSIWGGATLCPGDARHCQILQEQRSRRRAPGKSLVFTECKSSGAAKSVCLHRS